jgi:eukaryotic-like serine/threonine-protein kinase
MEDRRKIELVKDQLEAVHDESGVANSGVVNSGLVSQKSLSTTNDIGTIAPNNILDGKYLIGPIIGSGAFGLVYEARNLELDEKVALKTMRPEFAVDTAMVARFAREAKSAAAIKSEYVAMVYDVGVTSDNFPYIVMEYLDGKDLGAVLEESGALDARSAVEYALQACEALAVAHSKGIVHRDIKPENLLLTERSGGMRIVKVLDFGISKAALTGSIFGNTMPIVKTLNLMGTPLYMSPEQVRSSDHVDFRSDIWSLGMVLYEVLAGTTAFDEGSSITEICAAILETKPKPIELHRNDLPSGLVEVISKCLEKDVRRRYQNVAELALALMPFGPKRARLNVERAVAVLQGAGQADPALRVDSVMPPSSLDPTVSSIGIGTIPRMTAPVITPAAGAPPISAPPSTPSLAAAAAAQQASRASADIDITNTFARSKRDRTMRVVAVLAVIAGLGGAAAMAAKRFGGSTPTPTAATTTTPAATTAAPTQQAAAAPPPATTTIPEPPKTADTATTTARAAAPPTPPNAAGAWRGGNPGMLGGGAVGAKPAGAAAAARPPAATGGAAPATSPATEPAAPPTTPAAAANTEKPGDKSGDKSGEKGRTFRRDF